MDRRGGPFAKAHDTQSLWLSNGHAQRRVVALLCTRERSTRQRRYSSSSTLHHAPSATSPYPRPHAGRAVPARAGRGRGGGIIAIPKGSGSMALEGLGSRSRRLQLAPRSLSGSGSRLPRSFSGSGSRRLVVFPGQDTSFSCSVAFLAASRLLTPLEHPPSSRVTSRSVSFFPPTLPARSLFFRACVEREFVHSPP